MSTGVNPVFGCRLTFHYAVLEPHRALLRSRLPVTVWQQRLLSTFNARVLGPVFEEMARDWVQKFADTKTLGGLAHHIGPSTIKMNGVSAELDVVVAGEGEVANERNILAIGEAKASENPGLRHLARLEKVRSALGARAISAKLLLFGPAFTDTLVGLANARSDVELIGFDRLYRGS